MAPQTKPATSKLKTWSGTPVPLPRLQRPRPPCKRTQLVRNKCVARVSGRLRWRASLTASSLRPKNTGHPMFWDSSELFRRVFPDCRQKLFVVFIKCRQKRRRRHKTSSSQNVVMSFDEKTVLKARINKMINKQKTQVAKSCKYKKSPSNACCLMQWCQQRMGLHQLVGGSTCLKWIL